MQQLESAQKEIRLHRDGAERARKESLLVKSQLDSGTATMRFELDSTKSELVHLKQVIEALRVELETTKKQNSEVRTLLRTKDYLI